MTAALPDHVVKIPMGEVDEFAVRFDGRVLDGRFAKEEEAEEHLGWLQEWRRTGKCPIALDQKGPGGRPANGGAT